MNFHLNIFSWPFIPDSPVGDLAFGEGNEQVISDDEQAFVCLHSSSMVIFNHHRRRNIEAELRNPRQSTDTHLRQSSKLVSNMNSKSATSTIIESRIWKYPRISQQSLLATANCFCGGNVLYGCVFRIFRTLPQFKIMNF
jgi:hypothetical protein